MHTSTPLSPIPRAALMLGLLLTLSGCSFMKGLLNPSAAWAVVEPAPMSMVVRRAEVAAAIADQVDRVLSETPADAAAHEALKITSEDAEALLTAASSEPIYQKQALRVVPAEAWLATLTGACGAGANAPPLIGLLGEQVAAKYVEVMRQGAEIERLEKLIERHEDDKGKVKKLERELEKVESSYPDRVDQLLEIVRVAASKLDEEDRDRIAVTILNLANAVEDGRIANSAAMLRYPIAAMGILEDLEAVAPRIIADVVEEQTGRRPVMNGFVPGVSFEDGDVELTLNGIPVDELGGMSLEGLLREVTDRAQAYATSVVVLLVSTTKTEERLELLANLLEAWADEMGVSEGEGVVSLTDIDVESTGKPPMKKKARSAKIGRRSATGIAVHECSGPMPQMIARLGGERDAPTSEAEPRSQGRRPPRRPAPNRPAVGRGAAPARVPLGANTSSIEWIDDPLEQP